MAFDTRCPECESKLRLDDAPAPGVPVECPTCGNVFRPAPAKKAKAASPFLDDEDDRPAKKPTRKPERVGAGIGGGRPKTRPAAPARTPVKGGTSTDKPARSKARKAKKKRTNPIFLLIAIGFGFGGLVVVGGLMAWVLGRAGRVTEMMAFVPADVNWVRGVNTGQLAKYPGYKAEVDKHVKGGLGAAAEELAKASGQDPARFLDYLLIARTMPDSGQVGTMYVMRSAKKMDPAATGAALGGSQTSAGAEPAYKMGGNAPGILAGATVYFPTKYIAVVVEAGPLSGQMLSQSAAGKAAPKESYVKNIDATTKVAIRGSIWLLVRATGQLKGFVPAGLKVIEGDFTTLDKAANAPTFACWTTPGGSGVRVGVGLQMADKKAAQDLVKAMKESQLGNGDESDPTNKMRQTGITFIQQKRVFGEFMQYLKFKSEGECAYVLSSVSAPESITAMLGTFNNPAMANR